MAGHPTKSIPLWSLMAPVIASVFLSLKFAGVLSGNSGSIQILASLLLGASVFAAVHHAEVLAFKLGEPFGSILLAVAVTVIEVALIVSILLSNEPGNETIARDTVFSAVIIVLNGVIGLCLIVGGTRHHEQSFQLQGASSALSVLGTLAVLAMILPNYTLAVSGPFYSSVQLMVIGLVSLILYFTFVFVQTVRHRDYFIDVETLNQSSASDALVKPSTRVAAISILFLLISLVAVVLLAKFLSHPLEVALRAVGLPSSFLGVVIAGIVLLPEGIAAVKAALVNRLQNSINLALGSAMASIGLTIPVVALVTEFTDQKLKLGLNGENSVLLILSLFVSVLTFGTGRTTILQGVVHLILFSIFLLISIAP